MRSYRNFAFLVVLALIAKVDGARMYVGGSSMSTVGVYDAATGAPINASLISGLRSCYAMAIDGNGHLFVANGSIIGEYDAITGAAINDSLITHLVTPLSMALDGNGNLLVGVLGGAIEKFDATTGALINSTFIRVPHPYGMALDGKGHLIASTFTLDYIEGFDLATGAAIDGGTSGFLEDPWGVAMDKQGHLFVANEASSHIGEYDFATGAEINSDLFSVSSASVLALDDSGNVFAASYRSDGSIYKYDASTGVVSSFITGLNYPDAILIVPEPSGVVVVGLCTMSLLGRRRGSRRARSGTPATSITTAR